MTIIEQVKQMIAAGDRQEAADFILENAKVKHHNINKVQVSFQDTDDRFWLYNYGDTGYYWCEQSYLENGCRGKLIAEIGNIRCELDAAIRREYPYWV